MCGKGDAVREKACNRKLHDNRLCRAYRRKLCGEREGKRVMKKVIAIMAVMTMLVCGIGMNVSAATQDVCHHNVGTYTITYGTQKTSTYTHPALVAYKPNGDPILVECTVTETYQPMRVICSGCGYIISDWQERVGITHSIKH